MKKLIFLISAMLMILFSTACSLQKIEKTNKTINENGTNQKISKQISRHPKAVDYTAEYGKLNKLPSNQPTFGYDIRSTDLSDCNLLNDYDKLLYATFDSKTKWPKKLPDGFNPKEVMELNKNPGLNVRSLHKKGITGKGVGIAIIDEVLLVDHIEYKKQLKYYSESDAAKKGEPTLHGAGVASIAVGKTVGVAPDADLYYIAADGLEYNNDLKILADEINELLDLNKTIPHENRIRVISISWGNDNKHKPGYDKLEKAYERAKEEGIFVITTSIYEREDMDIFCLDRTPLTDPDDFNSYQGNYFGIEMTYNFSVPMNFRCIASPTGTKDYALYSISGKSWAVPYVAGLYALACQVKPDITCEEFWKLAAQTSRDVSTKVGNITYHADNIVDPVAIIESLQKRE